MSWIKGIEKVEVSFTGTDTSQLLTTIGADGYDGYLVPFVTFSYNGVSASYVSPMFVDVYFTGSPGSVTVNFNRRLANGTAYVTAYIVEVDTAEVDVQYKSFQVTGTDKTTAITSVNTSKTFFTAYYSFLPSGTEYLYQSTVRTRLLNATTVDHKRANSNGTINGHFWTVEDLGTNFDVQHAAIDIVNPATFDDATITAVDMTKSFVISSYYNTYGARSANYAAVTTWLLNTTTVRASQNSAGGDSHMAAQVITLADTDAYVQRNQQAWGTSDTTKPETLSQEVDLDYSIPWIPTLTSFEKNDTTGNNDAFFDADFNTSTQISISRGASGSNATVSWEAIQFYTPPPPPPPPETVDFSGGIKMSNVIIK